MPTLTLGYATPSEAAVGTQPQGGCSVAWGAVRWHAGIAASSPGEETEILPVN